MQDTHDLVWDETYRCNVWRPKPSTAALMQSLLAEIGTVQYQAGTTIADKYRGSLVNTHEERKRVIDAAFIIHKLREDAGKPPSKDHLVQLVSQFAHGKHPEQEHINDMIDVIFNGKPIPTTPTK